MGRTAWPHRRMPRAACRYWRRTESGDACRARFGVRVHLRGFDDRRGPRISANTSGDVGIVGPARNGISMKCLVILTATALCLSATPSAFRMARAPQQGTRTACADLVKLQLPETT